MLTDQNFAALTGQTFTATATGGDVPLVLAEVKAAGETPPGYSRKPFSLFFRGDGPPLEQQIYTLRNAALGEVDIFLVPIGQDADGVIYEAVFN
jgi:hypothetical protein